MAFARGDVPTELTSNHLSSLRPDRVVQAAGTLVNLIAGAGFLLASSRLGARANPRYFFWLLAALNLLPGAGYFMFSGIFGFGDWHAVIQGLPYQPVWRLAMTAGGAVLYLLVVLAARGHDKTLSTEPLDVQHRGQGAVLRGRRIQLRGRSVRSARDSPPHRLDHSGGIWRIIRPPLGRQPRTSQLRADVRPLRAPESRLVDGRARYWWRVHCGPWARNKTGLSEAPVAIDCSNPMETRRPIASAQQGRPSPTARRARPDLDRAPTQSSLTEQHGNCASLHHGIDPLTLGDGISVLYRACIVFVMLVSRLRAVERGRPCYRFVAQR